MDSDIIINSRRKVKLTGVSGITSFSANEAVFKTELGVAAVTGSNLIIDNFDRENGIIDLEGNIKAVFYPSDKKDEGGIIKRMFTKK